MTEAFEVMDLLTPEGKVATQEEFEALMVRAADANAALVADKGESGVAGSVLRSFIEKAEEVATAYFVSKGEQDFTNYVAALVSVVALATKEGWEIGHTEEAAPDTVETVDGDSGDESIEPVLPA